MIFNRKKKRDPGMQASHMAPASSDPSFIGRNCVFEGHITCEGEIHIDGTVRGTVQAGMCVVDVAGVIQGTLAGTVIHVRGRVLGPIQGQNVFIHAGAHVEGDVYNDTISIENGAYVYGSIRHNMAPTAPVTAPMAPSQVAPKQLNLEEKVEGDGQNLRIVSNRK
jgi:cytoskeletal protein CcmA (bactofilin family)